MSRMERYQAQAEKAAREREAKEAILAIDVDSVLMKIYSRLTEKRIRVKDYFKKWDFLYDNRIAKKDLRASVKELSLELPMQEFKAILFLLDPNGSDFVNISELDEVMRIALRRSYRAADKEKSRERVKYKPPEPE